MIVLLCFGLYILGAILFCLWDSFIGLGCELDGYENPPLVMAACLWPIAIPILLVYNFARLCEFIKESRKERQESKRKNQEKIRRQEEKLRIAAEKEFEASMAQVEEEMRTYSATQSKNAR
jgi:hypothetical protein